MEYLWLCSPFHNYIKGVSCTSLHSFLFLDILFSHLHLFFSSDILAFGSLRSLKSLFLFIFFVVLKSLFRVVIPASKSCVSLSQIIRASSHHVFPRSGILCWQRSIPSKGAVTVWSWSIHASLDAESGLCCWIAVRSGKSPAIPRAASGSTSAANPQPTA